MMGNRSATYGDWTMRIQMTGYAVGLAVLLGGSPPAHAQDAPDRAKLHRRAPLRIEVTPSARLYRQCVDWHVVEHRATGDTVVPRMQCRWALRR
jgi:hypothetical protein